MTVALLTRVIELRWLFGERYREMMRPMEQRTTPPTNPTPKTDDEWTIHALNIHGLFFERWCQQVIREQAGWKLKAINYPVEFPRATTALRWQRERARHTG
jgi:hypothetical protein